MSAVYKLNTYFEETTCANCGVTVVLPQEVMSMRRKDGERFYCYNGHSLHFSKSKSAEQKLKGLLANETRRKNDALRRANEAQAEADKMKRKNKAERAAKTRLKNRIMAGVCPCCNRTFKNLQQHMEGQHKDFVKKQKTFKQVMSEKKLNNTELAKKLRVKAPYVSNYLNGKYVPSYTKKILDDWFNSET